MPHESRVAINTDINKKIVPLFSIDELHQHCLANAPITNDSLLKMCPGLFMIGAPTENKRRLTSTYGITKYDPETREPVAICGFNIEEDVMVIKNTPHGNRPEEFSSRQVVNRLSKGNFRAEMMQVMIDIAKNLGLSGIKGYPVDENHGEVPERTRRAVNELFESFDFVKISDSKLYYFYNITF